MWFSIRADHADARAAERALSGRPPDSEQAVHRTGRERPLEMKEAPSGLRSEGCLAEPESSAALALARLPEVLGRDTPHLSLNNSVPCSKQLDGRDLSTHHAPPPRCR